MRQAFHNSAVQWPMTAFWMRLLVALLLCARGVAHSAELAWDATAKDSVGSFPEQVAKVQFFCTNTTTSPVKILRVRPSCGCITRLGRDLPWIIPPGGEEVLAFEINLRGKSGKLAKYVEVYTGNGETHLEVSVFVSQGLSPQDRLANLKIAEANRQSVFQGDCAGCHATPTAGKTGGELFRAACGICHSAEPRASMVPDLRGFQEKRDADFWRGIITGGKPRTLMPGFAISQGGPLTDAQIESLVRFLASSASKLDAPRFDGGHSNSK